MNVQIDFERLVLAQKSIHAELLAERAPDGRWTGHVASSPTVTAAAVCALVVSHRNSSLPPVIAPSETTEAAQASSESLVDLLIERDLSELVVGSLHWLARLQNPDGGWGDFPGALSNLAATAFVQAAFRLTGVPARYADLMFATDRYISAQHGVGNLRRRDDVDPALAAAALSASALAGAISWKAVPALPFHELASFTTLVPSWLLLTGREPHVPTPQLAVSIARHEQRLRRNPLLRFWQVRIAANGLAVLFARQAPDGSFLDSPLWTAVVVMNLAGTSHQEHPLVARGVEYLLSSIRSDASWPVVPELSTRNTALAVRALGCDPEVGAEQELDDRLAATKDGVDWLLHTSLRAASMPTFSAGYAPSAEPNVFDTSLVLQALLQHVACRPNHVPSAGVLQLENGISWLLEQQSADGSWPVNIIGGHPLMTNSPLSGDATCEVLCTLGNWRSWRPLHAQSPYWSSEAGRRGGDGVESAISRGFAWLVTHQSADGHLPSQLFGNELQPDGQNPVFATSRTLAAATAIERLDTPLVERAAGWLIRAQHANGGWGPPRTPIDYSGEFRTLAAGAAAETSSAWRANEASARQCSIVETAWAVSALLPLFDRDSAYETAVESGLNWLSAAVESDLLRRPSPVGVWPGRIWYDERLYPLVYASEAVSRSLRAFAPSRRIATVSA